MSDKPQTQTATYNEARLREIRGQTEDWITARRLGRRAHTWSMPNEERFGNFAEATIPYLLALVERQREEMAALFNYFDVTQEWFKIHDRYELGQYGYGAEASQSVECPARQDPKYKKAALAVDDAFCDVLGSCNRTKQDEEATGRED